MTNVQLNSTVTEREHVRQVLLHGHTALADGEPHTSMPIFLIGLTGFFNTPAVDEVDLSAYGGAVGDRITIRTTGGPAVHGVRVRLTNGDGAEIESGEASEVPPGSEKWVYFATRPVPANTRVRIGVIVRDRPGSLSIQGAGQAL